MIKAKKNINARSRKPSGGNLSSRIEKLENLIEELRDELDPKEMKIVIWSPHTGLPEPDRDSLPKNAVIVTMESPYPIQSIDTKELHEEREAELAKLGAERKAEIDRLTNYDPPPPQGGAHTHFDDQVTYEGYGVRWG